MERYAPAEPDDPNSSTLNPHLHGKLGVGKGQLPVDNSRSKEYFLIVVSSLQRVHQQPNP